VDPRPKTKPQNLYELVHGPSYDVEVINVDEVIQMNGSLNRRLRNFRSFTIEYEAQEGRVISLARWCSSEHALQAMWNVAQL
jgi:hypothetical protein